jgi:hypothetical protein
MAPVPFFDEADPFLPPELFAEASELVAVLRSVPPGSVSAEIAVFGEDLRLRLGREEEADADVEVFLVVAAGTARLDVSDVTSTVTPASSRARRTAFIRFIGTSAVSHADRTASVSTLPRVLP